MPTHSASDPACRSGVGPVTIGLILGVFLAPGAFAAEYRTIDGTANNVSNPDWGAAGTRLLRVAPPAYADGVAAMSGPDRPPPRAVSNAVVAQAGDMPNEHCTSDYIWQWGQFLDHDLDLTEAGAEAADIPTPPGDPFFLGSPIAFTRSLFAPGTSVPGIPREHLNSVTAFIDASNVYGSDAVRAAALRADDGTGRLRVSAGDLLPFNTFGLPNGMPPGANPEDFFVAGDVRANEQVGLTAMHTLFVREHNYWAKRIRKRHPRLSGDEIYERARAIVGAEMQAITYREFLPALLGPHAPPPYAGYDPDLNPGIATEFSTASYRFGHSALSPVLLRLATNRRPIPQGHLALRDAFFNPSALVDEGGIEPVLLGLAMQRHQAIDPLIVDDVRNFLFGPPGAGGFDLASLNVQRGRDHGLPDYNSVRVAYGLPPKASFDAVSADAARAAALESVYGTVDRIDPWVGGLAEDPLPGALVGELVATVLREQFLRLREGDRFYYTRVFPPSTVRIIERRKLSRVIRRNTRLGVRLQRDVFRVRGCR
jgi:peroxidase